MVDSDVAVWAASGAMALTGRADGPPLATPAGMVAAARSAAADVASMTARFGAPVRLDGPAILGERAALSGMGRRGSVSVGGAARFERVADGWVVLNLPRPEDVAALPALLEHDLEPFDWREVARVLAGRSGTDLVERATLLGLAVARLDERPAPVSPGRELARGSNRTVPAQPLVVDLTALWAGPLAGSILAAAGARVVKVEGRNRPDGARLGPPAFFDLMNADKEMLSIDFTERADVALLRRLIAAADLVIEGSRPRAMEQIGVRPEVVASEVGTSWLSITGHGRIDQPDRVGFGDDAAVAGGAWARSGAKPVFVADAVADPLTGLVAAALGAELLHADRAAVIETPLSRVAAWAHSTSVDLDVDVQPTDGGHGWEVITPEGPVAVAAPRSRASSRRAAEPDAHGPALREEFAYSRSR